MTVRSYAKINLGLRLLRKRPDGYHDIETVFHRVDLSDEIEFHRSEGTLSLTSDRDDLPTDAANLCIRAAELMRARAPAGAGVAMTLHKRIPIGAGLGGGSSNAATVLLALKDLWSVAIADAELARMALTLGSDVPFFLGHGSAAASGRGERLDPITLVLPYWIVVVVPPLSVSTAWAYRNVRLPSGSRGMQLRDVFSSPSIDVRLLQEHLTNDFEALVYSTHPVIGGIKQRLLSGGALLALLSGSGSAVFGLFADEKVARQAWDSFSPAEFTVSLTEPGFSPPVPHIVQKQ